MTKLNLSSLQNLNKNGGQPIVEQESKSTEQDVIITQNESDTKQEIVSIKPKISLSSLMGGDSNNSSAGSAPQQEQEEIVLEQKEADTTPQIELVTETLDIPMQEEKQEEIVDINLNTSSITESAEATTEPTNIFNNAEETKKEEEVFEMDSLEQKEFFPNLNITEEFGFFGDEDLLSSEEPKKEESQSVEIVNNETEIIIPEENETLLKTEEVEVIGEEQETIIDTEDMAEEIVSLEQEQITPASETVDTTEILSTETVEVLEEVELVSNQDYVDGVKKDLSSKRMASLKQLFKNKKVNYIISAMVLIGGLLTTFILLNPEGNMKVNVVENNPEVLLQTGQTQEKIYVEGVDYVINKSSKKIILKKNIKQILAGSGVTNDTGSGAIDSNSGAIIDSEIISPESPITPDNIPQTPIQ